MSKYDCAGRAIPEATFWYRLKMAGKLALGALFPSEPWQPSQWLRSVGPVEVSASPVNGAVVFHVPVRLDHVHLNQLDSVSILLDGSATVCLHNYVCDEKEQADEDQ